MKVLLQNLHLNSITAVILLDSDGNRILAKYYQPAHAEPTPKLSSGGVLATNTAATPLFRHPFQTLKEQRVFEAAIFDKTKRAQGAGSLLFIRCARWCTASKSMD